MADNVVIPVTGTGDATPSISAEEIASVKWQRVKLGAGKATSTAMIGHLEDDAHSSGDAGVLALVVRKDTAASLCGTDGDYTGLIVDSAGKLHVNVGNTVTVGSHAVTNAGTFAVQVDGAALTALELIDDIVKTDDAAFTPATSKVAMVGAEFDDTLPDSVDEGDAGALRMSGNRNLYTTIRDAAGNERGANVDASNALLVAQTGALPAGTNAIGKLAANSGVDIGDVDVTSVVPGTGATSLGKAVDAVAGASDTGVAIVGVRDDALSALTPVEGDYVPARFDANGALWVVVNGTVTVGSHAVTNAGTFAVQVNGDALTALQIMDDWDNGASDGCSVSGDVAHDSPDAGEPVKIGAKAETSPKGITAVADGDRTDLLADSDGMLMVKLGTSGADALTEAVSNTDGASTAFTNFSAVASTKNVVTAISAFRTDAGTGMAYVDFRDGAAGSVLFRMPLPEGGGSVLSLSGQPLFKTSANTALAFDVSAALTTVYISIVGYQTKV